MRFVPIVVLALLLGARISALAMYARPETVPVDRLIKIGEGVLRTKPESAKANYTLARIHYLAFTCASTSLDAFLKYDEEALPAVGPFMRFTDPIEARRSVEAERRVLKELKVDSAPDYNSGLGRKYYERLLQVSQDLQTSNWRPVDLPDPAAASHVTKALGYFQKAMSLDPKNALFRLGYASLLEQAHAWLQRHPEAVVPEFVKNLSPEAIRAEYKIAWNQELPLDLKDDQRGMFSPMDMVSYEAGTAYVRLARAEEKSLSKQEMKTLAKVQTSLVDLAKNRGVAMTPIIFSCQPATSINDLLANQVTVDFPLRGWGPEGRWPWVKPDTCLLVWNPSGSGRIASGAQLFGSYTWELFWKTGYEPLAVLDENGDGELRGAELEGLATWQDRNRNGVSDPGEVEPLGAAGVVAIATAASKMEGPHPMSPNGITFSDGRKLPTWDWVVTPLPPEDHEIQEKRRLTSVP